MLAALVSSCLLIAGGDRLFPDVPGWTCVPESTIYTSANLWDLIDGAADLFLEYRFEDLHLARYVTSKGEEIRLEVYRHATPVDAFGMYAAERSPDYRFLGVGTQGYNSEGIFNFFCGEYYVKLSTLDTARSIQQSLVHVARKEAEYLQRPLKWPPELQRLPAGGRIANSEQFVRRGFLGHQFLMNAFSAEYPHGARCFIIPCASAAEAEGMITKYRTAVHDTSSPRPDGSIVLNDPHNGPVALVRIGPDVAGVSGEADPSFMNALLSAATALLKGR